MSDTPETGTTTGQPQTARAWYTIPVADRYREGIRAAANERQVRAAVAASRTVALAHELAGVQHPDAVREEVTWELRGEPRTRATFALPHPGDFPGGLPLPRRD